MSNGSANIPSYVGSADLLFENRTAPDVLPTKLAARFISKSPNALRIMNCRGLIRDVGKIGNERYYAVSDLKKLLPNWR